MPKSKKWLTEWNKTIGGSRAPAIMGKSRWSNPRREAEIMSGITPMPNIDDSPDVRRGRLLEPIARKLIKESTGLKVKTHPQNKFVYNSYIPFAHALPDGWVDDDDILEIKWPRPARFQKVRLAGLDEEYMVQAQHNLMVTEAKKLYFAVCCCVTMDIILVPVDYDETFIKELHDIESHWYDRVQMGLLPEDQVEIDIDIPISEGFMTYVSSPEAIAAAKAFIEANEIKKEAEDLRRSCVDRLRELGDGRPSFEVKAEGDVEGIVRCYSKSINGKVMFDHKQAVTDNPELKKYYKTGKPFTTFTPYVLNRKG